MASSTPPISDVFCLRKAHSDVQELLGSMTSRNHFHGLGFGSRAVFLTASSFDSRSVPMGAGNDHPLA